MSHRGKSQAFLILAALALCGTVGAGTTGSLSGVVTDSDGDPVTGASVVIEGTPFGSMTDREGRYDVYALSPGTYTVTARMVGMTSVTREGIRIVTDQSTRVDFVLGIEAAGSTIIEVRDQRNLILETVPSTIHVIDRSEMRLMPVPDMLEIISRQPGIVSSGGSLHVRGGRAGEVAFLLDGIPVRSPVDNSFSAVLPVSAVSEASIITGGATAEYGNAMSGVVNMVSREGGKSYEGGVTVHAGDLTEFGYESVSVNYSSPSENDSYRDGCLDAEVSLGGPEPITAHVLPAIGIEVPWDLRLFGSARYMRSGRDLEDSRGYWENNWQNVASGSLKISGRPSSSTRVSVLGYYNYRQSGWDEWAWSRMDQPVYIDEIPYLGVDPDYSIPVRYQELGGVTASVTRMFSDDVFMEARLNQNRFCHWRRIASEDGGYFGDSHSPSDWISFFLPEPRVIDSLGFYHAGLHPEVWLESRSTVTTGRIDFTDRISGVTELKAGIEGSYYDIYDYSVHLSDDGAANVSLWKAYPTSLAAYCQTVLRFSGGMVMNAGLRYDLFLPNCRRMDAVTGELVDVGNKSQISPRIGLTNPVTDRDVFFVTYGHYFQMPNMNELFYGTDYNLSSIYSIVGNPDLEAEKTVAYEAGVRHRFSDITSLAFSTFYKDVTGLVRTTGYDGEGYDYYFLYENDDSHAVIWGVETKFVRLPGEWWSASAGYTYSVARGRYSSASEGWEYESEGITIPSTQDSYLDWDQRHSANASAGLSVPREGGPAVLGGHPFEGVGITMDWKYGSGFPFSPPPSGPVFTRINTERYPWTMQVDLSVSRRFWLGGVTAEAAITVFNLFDRRNLNTIFDTGYYLKNGEPGGTMENPGAWSPARHVFAKVGFSW
ncbi:MAG TPA: TonB-dependent receptor [Candidatus Fermentibacter daniensis]|nr:TonB-dependent receptor [Candidatus Fermentibacter daniensis]